MRPKDKGTREERRQRLMCEAAGLHTQRLAEQGIYDRGDFTIDVPLWGEWVVESKNAAQLNAHATLAKALNKAGHDDVVLWWKRTERKPGAQRRTQVGRPIVAMSEDLFLDILRELRDRSAQ